jgi:hypothetical protein
MPRLDKAERTIAEALDSEDPRMRFAASMFTIRNSHRARRTGWTTTSTSAAELSVTANAPVRTLTFRWRTDEDDKRDAEAAEAERLREEGRAVVRIGWEKPLEDDGKLDRGQAGERAPAPAEDVTAGTPLTPIEGVRAKPRNSPIAGRRGLDSWQVGHGPQKNIASASLKSRV